MVVRKDRAYFVLQCSHGDEIICLLMDPQTSQFSVKVDFLSKERVLALQQDSLGVNQISVKKKRGLGKLLVLDASYTMRLLVYADQKMHTKQVDLIE